MVLWLPRYTTAGFPRLNQRTMFSISNNNNKKNTTTNNNNNNNK